MSSRLAGKGACACDEQVSNIRLRPSPRVDIGATRRAEAEADRAPSKGCDAVRSSNSSAPPARRTPTEVADPAFGRPEPGPRAHPAIEIALDAIPACILPRSGSIFYSGRAAFSASSKLYILGLNPGGDPVAQAAETIGAHRQKFREGPAWWSEYADESWCGAPPGTWGMQPRVLYLIERLGLDPHAVPASNLIFVRSSTEATLLAEKRGLMRACWPVHRAVIDALVVQVVLCFGGTAGRWVRDKLGAGELIDCYRETNRRRWSSEAHRAPGGRVVLTLTHPGRANWCNPHSDPSAFVRRVLNQFKSC